MIEILTTARYQAITGIYCIRHNPSGKVYVGSACRVGNRVCYHRSKLNRGIHDNHYLQASWGKHGSGDFSFCLIEECGRDDLVARESFWMQFYKACDREHGFNLDILATNKRHSEETKLKIGAKHKGRKYPPEFGQKISAARKGVKNLRPRTPEQRLRHAAASRGHVLSAEGRAKIGAVHRGKKISSEQRRKTDETLRRKREAIRFLNMEIPWPE